MDLDMMFERKIYEKGSDSLVIEIFNNVKGIEQI